MSGTHRWIERRQPELAGVAERTGTVAILPLGAVEAHGPHLPLGTDVWIAEAMAREGARLLLQQGVEAWVLPTLAYAPAPFADGLAGTLSIRPETLAATIADVAAALGRRGVETLALANAHYDPAQVDALRGLVESASGSGRPRIVFPDLTRRALARRMSEEFRSGACHGGRYETSILLAERPELVAEEIRRGLPEIAVSLVEAMSAGHSSFESAGVDRGYCGDPAAASAEEGRQSVALLGRILAESVTAG